MSIKLMSAIFETVMRDLPYTKDGEERNTKASTAKLVLLALADHANEYGESTYPGYDHLEIKTALSRQGIADTLEALKQNGLLDVDVRGSRLGTNNYTINIRSFPPMYKEAEALPEVVKPLDYQESSHLTKGSQATRLESSLTTNEPSNGVPPNYSVEWQVAGGNQTVVIPDEMDAKMKDAANLISTGLGSSAELGYAIAMAFMQTRKILFTESQIKGQRKAIKALIEAHVYPKHVRDAVEKLMNDGMTITDLYSVTKTAISLANPTPESTGYNPQGLSIS